MAKCKDCLHNAVCELWRKEECRDANSILTGGIYDCPLFVSSSSAEAVVRCKDCRFRFDGCCLEPRNRIVFRVPDFGDHYGYAGEIMVAEDHFCGYGERKENNHG